MRKLRPLRLSHLFKVTQLAKIEHEDYFHLRLDYFKGDDVSHADTYTSKQNNRNENGSNCIG